MGAFSVTPQRSVFFPGGTTFDRSQVRSDWKSKAMSPSRRVRDERSPMCRNCITLSEDVDVSLAADHIELPGTDPDGCFSRHFTPGYDHSVPPGQGFGSATHAEPRRITTPQRPPGQSRKTWVDHVSVTDDRYVVADRDFRRENSDCFYTVLSAS